MLINVTKLLLSEGFVKEVNESIPIDKIKCQGITYSLKDEVKTEVKLTNIGKKEVEIAGKLNAALIIPCSRCTEEVIYHLETNFHRVASFGEKRVAVDDDDDDEANKYVEGHNIDLYQLVYEELIINFPMKVLCKNDCEGICNSCGCNININKCDCDNLDIDPRMAVFKDILKDY
ncbi:uncharacterized protein EDC18_101261 [Natranaerovirga pectinivora]|uniref:Metal-binding protein n=1 Tax=Natranaerovirga pectinivora TaxID=682400 RepID=A0A4R3MNW1_9FIRM|nr:DUF177 domain-containing protein [Natranaerovirga pectinivora]TCT16965.1 uncharacterized protein EDC18_101261 [Natranaerovirga pectinivora]